MNEAIRDRTAPRAVVSLTVCVFSGAQSGTSAGVRALAHETGRLIGARGHRLVYGCGGGLMAEVAEAAVAEGADVTGVIPRFLRTRESAHQVPHQRIRLTDTLFDRKQQMLDLADAFLALPGGYGTLDEILEVVTLNQLEVIDKPLVLLDGEGLWSGFLGLVDTLAGAGFIGPTKKPPFDTAKTAADALALLEANVHPTADEAISHRTH